MPVKCKAVPSARQEVRSKCLHMFICSVSSPLLVRRQIVAGVDVAS